MSMYTKCNYCKITFTESSSLARHFNDDRCKKYGKPQLEEEKLAMASFKSATKSKTTRKNTRKQVKTPSIETRYNEDSETESEKSIFKRSVGNKARQQTTGPKPSENQPKKAEKRKNDDEEGQNSKRGESVPRVILKKPEDAQQSTSSEEAGKTKPAKEGDEEVIEQPGGNYASGMVTIRLPAKHVQCLMEACGWITASLIKVDSHTVGLTE